MGDLQLPERLDMERLVLGAAMTDPEAFPQIADLLSFDDFALHRHRCIFRGLGALHARGEALSYVSVTNELLKSDELGDDGRAYLVGLTDGLPKLVKLATFCEPVRSAAVRRRAIESMSALIDRCCDPGEETADLLSSAERVTEILNAKGSRQLSGRTLDDIIADEGGLNSFLSPEAKPGIPIPFTDIHATLGGLRRSKLIILGARPAVGKTALAMQLAEHAAWQGSRVLMVTLEMSDRDLFHRAITGRAGVSAYKFREGRLSPQERYQLQLETAKLQEFSSRLIMVDKGDTTAQGISNLLRGYESRGLPIDLCIVDYLQLLSSVGSFDNRVQEVSKISRELKKITQTFQIPVIALSQLKRQEEHRKHERPELDWLKESGQLEQDADQVLFLWAKKDPEERENFREVEWRVAKNRDGLLNHGTLMFHARYCRFEEDWQTRDAVA